MRIQLDQVVKAQREQALPSTTLLFESGRVTLGLAETEQRPTVLALVASGRMHVDAGEVLLDGRRDPAGLRHRVALVDAPDVSAPEPNVVVASVVQEELMFAGRRAGPRPAKRWLVDHQLAEVARRPISNLEPMLRLRLLCELAVLREHIEGLVLVSPDRHGGDPRNWWGLAGEFAERGYAVLVIAGEASRLVLAGSLAPADVPAPTPTSGQIEQLERADREDQAEQTEQLARAEREDQAEQTEQTEQPERADQAEHHDQAEQTARAEQEEQAGQAEQAERADQAGEDEQ